jgi:hypothetical protein
MGACTIAPGAYYVYLLKVIRNKLTNEVYANSARVRCAIYSRDTAIRISSVPRFKGNKRLSKVHHITKLWASQNIFPDPIYNIFSEYGHILGKTLW